ncbi:LysR family transcriptional regulator [Rhodococcus tukisamuensis]|uniref:DNA-binding transcriptional regulator, LysR family n=1 Tax=Rhodococcus tukisamuensis TaxID=168276 RepID=A0A1G6WAJ0_9NOCA|nr:LysR family transcriptional regulator [Rhodococcus tukisamuensis]SDD62247.1 DNA-binding transcriptional regulator, LysR family [Rhodococcus tukisamuensis]
MDLKQIEYFLAVVDHGGIAGAALTLGVAQPTISTGIRSLERALGVPLFHRLGRGMVLSSAGRALLGPGRQILRDTAAAKYNLASTSASLVGRLDIMAMPMLGLTALAEAIAAFRALHPRVIVHIKEFRDDTAPVELIRDGHCEFVASHIPLPEAEALQSLTLTVHEYWLAYPPGTVLPPGPVPLAVLPRIPMVWLSDDRTVVARRVQHEIQKVGEAPPSAAMVEHRESRLPLVVAGVGGAVVERSTAESMAEQAVVRPIAPPLNRAMGLTFDPDRLSVVAREFLTVVRERSPFSGPPG